MSEHTDELLQHGFRYAYSLTHQVADAEDLLHDAWVKLSAAKKTINKPLLFTSIRNLFIDQYRRNNLINIDIDLQLNELVDRDLVFDSPIPDDVLQTALERLRPNEREILFLHTIEEYTAEEISHLTKSSRGTVLSSLFRARKKLKKLLGKHHEGSLDTAAERWQ